jgi:16S rRNA (guanine966-N2)-methyltransferase
MMARHRKAPLAPPDRRATTESHKPVALRIVGGSLRGRKLAYSGDARTRPMKDRLREAIFNLLGPAVKDKHAIDLFAGTGALGLEAISRAAARATCIEQHFPTAALIRQNAEALGVGDRCQVHGGDAFIWIQRLAGIGDEPWLAFCCPPYAFYVDRQSQMLAMIQRLLDRAPAESILVVESDDRFEMRLLPQADRWTIRQYSPAVVAIYRK